VPDLGRRPGPARIVRLLDQLEEQPGRVRHPHELAPEPLQHRAVLDVVAIEVVLPELQRARRNCVGSGRQLT
jgi:hypothetical protein